MLHERTRLGVAAPASSKGVGTRVDFIRALQVARSWLGWEQPSDAIGSQHGISSSRNFRPGRDLVQLHIAPYSVVGKPVVQVSLAEPFNEGVDQLSDNYTRVFANEDRRLIGMIVSGVFCTVTFEWDTIVYGASTLCYAVATEAHPSLLKAVTHNYRSNACSTRKPGCPIVCGTCPSRLERFGKFRVPEGWT